MSTLHLPPSMFIPRSWQRAPFLPHAFIIRDRIYDIATSPPVNYNPYYEPAYTRKPAIRKLSGRIMRYHEPRRRLPVIATVHYLSQLRMQHYLDSIKSMKNRL